MKNRKKLKRREQYRLKKKQKDNSGYIFLFKLAVFLSLFAFSFIVLPFLEEGIFSGHDILVHLLYLRQFQEALFQGQFPVRIIDWSIPGLNHPVFNFYQPGFYYLFMIPKIFGLPNYIALNLTLVSLWLSSGLFMFLFARRHIGDLPAVLASFLYVFAPYHILVIFVRGALTEFTALTFIPAIFWAMDAYFERGKSYYILFISALTGLAILSHPPTFIMFSPLILTYVLYLYWQKKSVSHILSTIFSFILGFGMISFFLLPAFLEQKYTQPFFLRTGYYFFENHFVCPGQLFITSWNYGISNKGCLDGMSFQVGIAHWLGVLIIFFLLVYKLLLKKYFYKLGLFRKNDSFMAIEQHNNNINYNFYLLPLLFLFFFIISIFMMTSISQFYWETIPYLSFFQYPWRFLVLSTFTSSFLGGYLLSLIKKDYYRYPIYIGFVLLIVILYKPYLHPLEYFKEEKINFENQNFLKKIGENIQKPQPILGYLPVWTDALPLEGDVPQSEAKILNGKANINQIKRTAAKKEYVIIAEKQSEIRFFTHYFPGWNVYIDGKKSNFSYDNAYGYIDVSVSSGKHSIVLNFENTPVRTFGNTLSIVSLFIAFSFISMGIISARLKLKFKL